MVTCPQTAAVVAAVKVLVAVMVSDVLVVVEAVFVAAVAPKPVVADKVLTKALVVVV